MPIEVLEIPFEQAVNLLARLGDIFTEAFPLPIIYFAMDEEAVHYKMAWSNEPHLGGNFWRAPTNDAVELWLAENAPSREFHDLTVVDFETCAARDRFMCHL